MSDNIIDFKKAKAAGSQPKLLQCECDNTLLMVSEEFCQCPLCDSRYYFPIEFEED